MSHLFGKFLEGKTAIITGGSKNLGAQIALDIAQAGANIILFDRSLEQGNKVVEEIRQLGSEVLAIRGDVTRELEIIEMLNQAKETFGGVDILIHNAGPWTDQRLKDLELSKWDAIMDANVKGAFMLSQLVYPLMKDWGRIIHLSADSSFVRNHTVYGLAKHSVNALIEALALELAPKVNVNGVSPGLLDDPSFGEEILVHARKNTPLGKLVSFEEVSQMIVAICSPLFDMVTGKVIVMDGGRTIPRYDHHPPAKL